MKVLNFFKDKALYLLINIFILFSGYFLTHEGIDIASKNNNRSVIFISIGTSLVATSIVMFLELIRHLSISGILSRINNLVYDAGLQWIYKKRDLDKYDKLMNNLTSSLDVAGYSLNAFFDSYSKLLSGKLTNNKITVRMLLVNPDSAYSKNRAKIEGRKPEQFKDSIETLINYFKDTKGVEIRYFDAPLSTMIFRIDKVMFVGPHLYKVQSKATLTQELKSGHWLYEEYREEFERMWNDSILK